jgi:hypothetical protein
VELGSEHINNVLLDCCMFEWFENGQNLVQRYAETHAPASGTDEGYLLNAYLQANTGCWGCNRHWRRPVSTATMS